jgi:predicted kinase/predicted DNA-binding transcriptional regulator YafY
MHPICHVLIGVPGAGKSTFASQWKKEDRNFQVVSTDKIRAELFGDEQIQSNWQTIEAEVLNRVKQAIIAGHSVIYDATNAKRPWRIDMLKKFASVGVHTCVGWYLNTPIKECLQRNSDRLRQVDENVIASFAKSLQDFEPIEAEGFAKVYAVPLVNGKFDWEQIQLMVQKLPRAIINRRNRNCCKILHQYSGLLDFERLMHLIALLIRFPGAGSLHSINPEFLQRLLGDVTQITDSLSEISALIARLYHPIYANAAALAIDLEWLEQNGIIGEKGLDEDIQVSDYTGDITKFDAHTYSDLDLFARLIKTIRYLAHYPCFRTYSEQTNQELLWLFLQKHIYGISQSNLRKDIQRALHPYKILPNTSMKRAYFIGTAILTKHELAEVFKVLQTQVEGLEDPIALSTYQAFKEKLESSQLLNAEQFSSNYPVRAIANQPIVDIESLPDYTAYQKLDELTAAITSGKALEIDRFAGTGYFPGDPHLNQPFQIWPLQLVFHNIGWYLGYECANGAQAHLLKFERLDRIFIRRILDKQRTITAQKQALSQLETLYKASGSLFVGNSVKEQQKYLDKKQRASVETVLELWCNDNIFRFISEGTKRFPPKKIKMSKPLSSSGQNCYRGMFSLSASRDSQFPNRFQVILPCWSIQDDVNLLRWIVGFGGNVKVVQPQVMVEKVKSLGNAICQVYEF